MRRVMVMVMLPAVLLLAPAGVPAQDIGLAVVEVQVTASGAPLAGATVFLDLNDNGVWDEHLDEPRDETDADGVVLFADVVSVGADHRDDGPVLPDWHATRILTGNLRGLVGAREAQFDYALPPGVGPAALALYDLRGRRLARTRGDDELVLNLPANLPSGVYFVRLSAGAAAPVSHRLTSVGERTRAIIASRVTGAEAVAAGWIDARSGEPAKDAGSGELACSIVAFHPAHGMTVMPVVLVPGYQVFQLAMSLERPVLLVGEPYLGQFQGVGVANERALDIVPGQPLNFQWAATADAYGGEIASYRYGWNLGDPDDPDDPGWAVEPGIGPLHQRTPPDVSFSHGIHSLTIEAVDSFQRRSRWTFILSVLAIPDLPEMMPLLVVDDVFDRNSNAWPSAADVPLDNDIYRDQFWSTTLAGAGGVEGWDPVRDVVDTEVEPLDLRTVVTYRSLIWTTRYVSGQNSVVGGQFRPLFDPAQGDRDQYVWLAPYQQFVGNVLYAGSQALAAHLAEAPYELPIIFASTEGDPRGMAVVEGTQVRRSFGIRLDIDDEAQPVGPTRYPYAIAGIATLDIMAPQRALYEFGNAQLISNRRKPACAGMKGLVLDPGFKTEFMPGNTDIPDTIWTDPLIGWRDLGPPDGEPHLPPLADPYLLSRPYTWGSDEFYDANVIGRPTPYEIQQCDGEDCVAPMFRAVARYDWIRQGRLELDPDDTWPVGYYDGPDQPLLTTVCGGNALLPGQAGVRTNDAVVAFVARKTAPQKPSQVGDIVLGFDPYRFDNQEMHKVIRWVLGEHFGLAMNPGR